MARRRPPMDEHLSAGIRGVLADEVRIERSCAKGTGRQKPRKPIPTTGLAVPAVGRIPLLVLLYLTGRPSRCLPLRALNSAVECHLHTVEVIGSNPIAPTMESTTYDRFPGAIAKFTKDAKAPLPNPSQCSQV